MAPRLFHGSAWFKRQYTVPLREGLEKGLEHLVTPVVLLVADKLLNSGFDLANKA